MNEMTANRLYKCDLCHRSVDVATRERARHAWEPMIICESCVRDAQPYATGAIATTAGAAPG